MHNILSFLGGTSKLTLTWGIFDSRNASWTKYLSCGSSGQLLVACPKTLHKAHRGYNFGDLGVGGAWGSLSFESFLLDFSPRPDAFAIGASSYWGCDGTKVAIGVMGTIQQRQSMICSWLTRKNVCSGINVPYWDPHSHVRMDQWSHDREKK